MSLWTRHFSSQPFRIFCAFPFSPLSSPVFSQTLNHKRSKSTMPRAFSGCFIVVSNGNTCVKAHSVLVGCACNRACTSIHLQPSLRDTLSETLRFKETTSTRGVHGLPRTWGRRVARYTRSRLSRSAPEVHIVHEGTSQCLRRRTSALRISEGRKSCQLLIERL